MYNRYIPQSDGSYRRSRVPDSSPEPSRPSPPREECPPPEREHCPPPQPEKEPECREEPKQKAPPRGRCQRQNACPPPRQNPRPPRQEPHTERIDGSVTNFLRNLLPRDFDTGDLLVVILLLLMAGDCSDDRNTALLTLALYLFM